MEQRLESSTTEDRELATVPAPEELAVSHGPPAGAEATLKEQRKNSLVRAILQCAILLLAAAVLQTGLGGCGLTKTNFTECVLGSRNGKAMLTIGKTHVVFPDVPIGGSPNQPRKKALFIQTSLAGSTTAEAGADGVTFTYSYTKGVCTVSLANHSFDVLAAGTKLRVAGRTYNTDQEQTIVVASTSHPPRPRQ